MVTDKQMRVWYLRKLRKTGSHDEAQKHVGWRCYTLGGIEANKMLLEIMHSMIERLEEAMENDAVKFCDDDLQFFAEVSEMLKAAKEDEAECRTT